MIIDSANDITRFIMEEFKLIHKRSQLENVALIIISLNCLSSSSKSDI